MDKLKIVTMNVRGLADYSKRRNLFHYLRIKKYDIIMLQETHLSKKLENVINTQWGAKCWYSHGTSASRGVAIFFRKTLACQVHNVINSNEGRYLILYVSYKDKKLLFVNIYAPNVDNPIFFQELFHNVKRFTPHYTIIGGDFNFAFDLGVDKVGSANSTHNKSRKNVFSNKDALELVDVWRWLHPDKFEFTWKRLNPSPTFVRLDYFLISKALLHMVAECNIDPPLQSDHSAVSLEILFNFTKRGPGYWKFNVSLLLDSEYVSKISKLLDIELAQNYTNKRQKIEMIKLAVRGSTIQFASRKKKAKNNELLALQRKLKQNENALINCPLALVESKQPQSFLIQQDISAILTDKSKGAVICSRSKFEFHGERPSKYFLNLEKQKYCNKTIYRLQKENGEIVNNPQEILKMQKEFYENLYTSQVTPDRNYLKHLNFPQISRETYDRLKADITIEELTRAVKMRANSKTPSTDGLPIEFYKTFWDKLKCFLCELYKEIIISGQFHLTARQGIISLLEKPESNTLLLKSWRPLTLLNSDYKLFSKVLAIRLHDALQEVIHPSQTGFIKGRYVSENIMKLMNLIEHCNRTGDSAIVISIDFEKAFDKLEFSVALLSLEKFGIGPKFINMIKTLYNGHTSTVLNNGHWSDWFFPSRGTRQGDPISSLIFTAAVEALGIKLRTSVHIAGIEMNGEILLNSQYADDMWLALQPTIENINHVLLVLQEFADFSGLTINFNKTTACILGPLRDTDAKFYTMKPLFWSDGPVKILGTMIHPDPEILYYENFHKMLNKIENILNCWSHRSLSTKGKITVINTLISTLLVHKFMSLPTPKDEFFAQYKRLIIDFIWNGKPSRIRYSKLIQNLPQGGLKLVDLAAKNHSLKAAWVVRWQKTNRLNSSSLKWLYSNLPFKDSRIWECNFDTADLRCLGQSHFDMGRQILHSWSLLTFQDDFDYSICEHTPIWGNSLMSNNRVTLFSAPLIDSNICTLLDIWNWQEKRCFSYEEILNIHGQIPRFNFLVYNAIITGISPI